MNFEKAVLRGKGANIEHSFGKHGEAVGVAKHNAQLAEITHESAVCAQKYGIEPVGYNQVGGAVLELRRHLILVQSKVEIAAYPAFLIIQAAADQHAGNGAHADLRTRHHHGHFSGRGGQVVDQPPMEAVLQAFAHCFVCL